MGFRIPCAVFQIPGTLFQCLPVGFWIPIVSGIPDSLSCIADSKTQDSGLFKQNFPDSLTRDEGRYHELIHGSSHEKIDVWPGPNCVFNLLTLFLYLSVSLNS